MSSTSVLKMPGYRGGNKRGMVQIRCRQSGWVAPYRRNGKEPGVSHLLDLETVVFPLEIQVGFAWNDHRLRRNRLQRCVKIAVIFGIGRDVRMLPSPKVSQQVVAIALQEIRFPRHHEIVFKRGEAGLPPHLITIKRLRHRHGGVIAAHSPQTAFGTLDERSVLKTWIRRPGRAYALDEYLIVRRGLSRAAEHH